MNISQTENELVIRETPGCLWLFGLFFAFIGGVCIYGLLDGLTDYLHESPLLLTIFFLMCSSAIAVGIWIIHKAPITKIVADRFDNTLVMTRYGLFGKSETSYDFDDIEYFYLLEEIDEKGSPIWFFAMKLSDDDSVKITALSTQSEEYKRTYIFQINDFMRKQLTSPQMIFEIEDEEDEEMR